MSRRLLVLLSCIGLLGVLVTVTSCESRNERAWKKIISSVALAEVCGIDTSEFYRLTTGSLRLDVESMKYKKYRLRSGDQVAPDSYLCREGNLGPRRSALQMYNRVLEYIKR